jgi:hypothetical protein
MKNRRIVEDFNEHKYSISIHIKNNSTYEKINKPYYL